MRNLITDVPGISVGNAEDHEALTGVTVILPDRRSVCAVDSRGGAPGTRETDALSPACLVDAVDAVVLSGGSVYGLDAASGVTAWLGARGRGFLVHEAAPRSPIVPAAILYDLNNGGSKDWGGQPPYAGLGKEACAAAVAAEFALGNAGAGLGALAGALKGGLGSASAQTSGGITVGALVAVNAFGSAVVPGASAFWAAPFERDGEFGGKSFGDHRIAAAEDIVWDGAKGGHAGVGSNTTIGVVAADVRLSPAEAQRLAIMAQDGFSRSLRPIHTPLDGDTLFAVATGAQTLGDPSPVALAELGAVAADTVARAVARGVYEAQSVAGYVCYRDKYAIAPAPE